MKINTLKEEKETHINLINNKTPKNFTKIDKLK